jgi:hypothetical protein
VLSGDKCRRAERNVQLVASAVVVPTDLATACWDFDSEKGSNDRWREAVQSSVDVPAVEASVSQIIFGGNDGVVECAMVRMLQLNVFESFI